jgi:hypothetical protein
VAAERWDKICCGWLVVITDHVLTYDWSLWLEHLGRYVFAPVPAIISGGGVRLSGDGPSSCTRWIVASRPRHKPYSVWGTLPGFYLVPREQMPIIGGKPVRLMRALVRDYSRPGDTVLDPCCGAGTTLVAAKEWGRNSIGYDLEQAHVEVSRERVAGARQAFDTFLNAGRRPPNGELF